MSRVTTAPAPITALAQIVTGRMVALVPTSTPSPTTVGRQDAPSREIRPVLNRSFTNFAPCEMKQRLPIVTFSQMKACDWMRQCEPIVTLAPNRTSTIPVERSVGSAMGRERDVRTAGNAKRGGHALERTHDPGGEGGIGARAGAIANRS